MYEKLKSELDKKNVTLVAVSKTKPPKDILKLYNKGHRIFGENRVQELKEKYKILPKDIQWHLIGQLQKNKVKHIVPIVTCIQSVDSLALAQAIQKEALKNEKNVEILLQIKIAKEERKSGFEFNHLLEVLNDINELSQINIIGIMGIGTFTSDRQTTISEFKKLTSYFLQLKKEHFVLSDTFKEISMGMSGDYKTAIDYGSTMVRIGSLLFGNRT